jgi:pimeloyl-ACP methyl ester carboxylesterase
MASVDVRGVSIHYAERNAQRGDGLVLLHAFPVHGGMWRGVMEGVPATWRVIAPDFRGFGGSQETGGAGAFSIEALADDVQAMVEQLGLGRVVLAGLSMGGYVALAFARKYPRSLRGLILLDTKAGADTAEGKENRDRMIAIAREKGAKPIAQAMLGKMIPAETAAHRPQLVQELTEMMESTRAETIAAALAAMRDRPDRTGELASIHVPTLVGVGDQDEITPVAVAKEMAAKIPGARLKVFTGSGHMSAMEQPSQVAAAVTEFLARV